MLCITWIYGRKRRPIRSASLDGAGSPRQAGNPDSCEFARLTRPAAAAVREMSAGVQESYQAGRTVPAACVYRAGFTLVW